MRDPRQAMVDRPETRERFLPAMSIILKHPVMRNVIIGGVLTTMASASMFSFGPAYLIRNFELSASEAGLAFGLISGTVAFVVNIACGWLTSRLVRRNRAWAQWVPAIGTIASAPAAALFLLAPTLPLSLLGLALQTLFCVSWMAPSFATMQAVAGPERRATAAACLVSSYTLIGFGLGPVYAGFVSDLLKPSFGSASIGAGLLALQPFALWAGIHFMLAARGLDDRGGRTPAQTAAAAGA
jgi:MFS family permease